MGKARRFFAAFCIFVVFAAVVHAQEQPKGAAVAESPKQVSAADPFFMDLDSLANTKVTTASKFSQKLSDAPSVMTVVSQDELKRFGGTTLAEILDRVPGLNTGGTIFTDRSMLAVNGDHSRGDNGHVLFLINGRPVREVMQGGVSTDILEAFPVNALDRIEVIQGPGSVLYGSNAYSGVINLITKKAVGESVIVRAAGGASSAAATSGEILFSRGGVSILAAGQYHQMPRWHGSYSELGVPPQNASSPNRGEGGFLNLTFKGLSFMSSYTGFDTASFVQGTVGDVHWKRGFADLGYSLKATTKWDMAFNLTYTRNTLDVPQFPSVHRDSNQVITEWSNFVTLSDKDRLTFGAAFNHIQGTESLAGASPSFVLADGGGSAIAFYAQHEHKLTDELNLIGGFQANKIAGLGLNVVPRVGIVWSPASRFTLKGLYGGAFRAPSIDETSLNHPWIKGNPRLLPESIGSLDIRAGYQGNRLESSVGYFHNTQSNSIIQDTDHGFPFHFANLAERATFQGVSGEGKYYLKRDWFVAGSALYQLNHSAAIEHLTPLPSFSAKAGVSYLSKTGADLSIFDAFRGHVPGYAAALNPRPDAFHSLNAHVRFDLSKRFSKNDANGFAVFLHANNLTDRQMWIPAWGSARMDTIPFAQGRTIFYGIEVWQKKAE